jgi:predicted O-methyltransferase YrrM
MQASDPEMKALLQELEQLGAANDAKAQSRADKMLNITPDTGRFLYQLARSSRARTLLEVGTSNGYSTLWLAMAARANGGRVMTLDISPHKHEMAWANLQRAGLAGYVEFRLSDAATVLAELGDESIDILFLDAERLEYPRYWPNIQRVLRSGGLVVTDNALSHAIEIADFVEQVVATPGYLAETYAIGKGEFVILKDC